MPDGPHQARPGGDDGEEWQRKLRAQFPIIANRPDLVYLDSAATSQKPRAVLAAVAEYLVTANANAGRGSYRWANVTTGLIQQARTRVRTFLADPDPGRSSVHFGFGATEALHRVAFDWLAGRIGDGDEILVPFGDHQANLVPWLELRDEMAARGLRLRVLPIPVDPTSGDYDHRALPDLVTERTRLVAMTHVHHVYGGDMNAHLIRRAVGPDIPICLDAAQSVGHLPLSLADLDVDFVAFSGHKALALPGTGVLWAGNRRGPVFIPGGWQGTPNTAGIVSLLAALDWLADAGLTAIHRWTADLATRLTSGLVDLGGFEILGCQRSLRPDPAVRRRVSVVSFRHHRVPAADLGFVLGARGIMVRSDAHCQAGVSPREQSVRVSLHVYNTPHEIDRLLETLSELTVGH